MAYPEEDYWARPRARNRRHPEDGLSRLLPDRFGLHQVGQGPRHSRSGRAAGRGAGSMVAWAMTITDPWTLLLRFGLLFERFLNPERVSMPDFDVDFCQEQREEVITLRPGQVRPRPRGSDHHFRHAAGTRRSARRRPGDAVAAGPGRPSGYKMVLEQPGQSDDPRPGHRYRTAPAPGARRGRNGREPARHGASSLRACSATPRPTPPAS